MQLPYHPCDVALQASIIEQQAGVRHLLRLSHAVRASQHEVVLEALARLTATWPQLMRAAFAEDDSFKRKIEEQLKSPSPEARFVACLCLANHCQGRSFDTHPNVSLIPLFPGPCLYSAMCSVVTPCIQLVNATRARSNAARGSLMPNGAK